MACQSEGQGKQSRTLLGSILSGGLCVSRLLFNVPIWVLSLLKSERRESIWFKMLIDFEVLIQGILKTKVSISLPAETYVKCQKQELIRQNRDLVKVVLDIRGDSSLQRGSDVKLCKLELSNMICSKN